jgi:hypothetical protein
MMAVEVLTTEEFEEWFDELDKQQGRAVAVKVGLLRAEGWTLGFPHSSALKGTRYALRELRAQAGRHALRVVYGFDPVRRAVLLLGGDKAGDDRFYERMIPKAERLWERHIAEITGK